MLFPQNKMTIQSKWHQPTFCICKGDVAPCLNTIPYTKNIKMNITDRCGGMTWIKLHQGSVQCQAFIKAIINTQVPQKKRINS